ncbi:DUF3048 domain-containing protein [Paenibacillus sp.]|uniref:DUF3048 domain-containing protein n=1 Tax=Paenibacillus sp. TaxID=58172 RepID=UPI0035CCD9AD
MKRNTGKDKIWFRLGSSMICLALCGSLLASCGGPKAESPKEPVVEEQTPPEEPAQEDPVGSGEQQGAYTSPLTGLPLDMPVTQRPLSVMINNAPAARPQSGLTQADIVYEVLAEGGITRIIGIFQSKGTNEKIGPIRSIRPYLIDIGESYGGVLVHAGGSNDAYAILQKQHKEDLDEIGNAGAYFWRDKTRKAPHNLYSDADKLREGADKRGYKKDVNVPAYTFRTENDLPEGENASGVDITFLLKNYKVTYQYNEADKLYLRSINGQPHIDVNTGKQLTATNVVILGANHKTLDDVGRLAVDLVSGGEAFLLQQGKVIKGNWERSKGDVIRFVKDGKEVPLYPGTTYFNIVPNAPTFESHVNVLHQP